jgi:hypothetical protein
LNSARSLGIKIFLVILQLTIAIFFLNFPLVPKTFILILILTIFAQLFIYKNVSKNEISYVATIFFLGFFLRIFLAIIIHNFARGFFVGDDGTYEAIGNGYYRYWMGMDYQLDKYAATRGAGSIYFYSIWNAIVYYMFGFEPLLLKVFNSFISSMSALYAYFISREFFNLKVGKIVFFLATFFPSLVLWSTQNIRDPLAIFAIVTSVYYLMKIQNGKNAFSSFLKLIASMLLLLGIRSYIFVLISISFFTSSFIQHSRRPIQSFLVGLIVIILANGFYQAFFSKPIISEINLKAVAQHRNAMAYGRTKLQKVDISTPNKALWYLPIGIIYILFAPFPWQISSKLQLFTLPETLIWYVLFFFFLRGFYLLVKSGYFIYISPIISPALAMTVTYALVEGNVGTAYRHKAQFLIFYFIIVAIGIVYKNYIAIPKGEFNG